MGGQESETVDRDSFWELHPQAGALNFSSIWEGKIRLRESSLFLIEKRSLYMLKLKNSRKRYVAIGEREEQKGPQEGW